MNPYPNSPRSSIPYHLSGYQIKAAYFVTYYGDILQGTLWYCPGYNEGFFIVPNNNLREAQDLMSTSSISPEKLRELGTEIKDHRIIKDVLRDNSGFSRAPIKTLHRSGQQFTQTFVFGAGASTFCVFGEQKEKFRQKNYNPPTGFEIFDNKYSPYYEPYQAAKQSIPEFEFRGKDIEACLEDEWRRCKGSYCPDVTSRHINIQFYLQELFQKISAEVIKGDYRYNLYALFCKRLSEQLTTFPNRVATLISFNYDSILDHFVENFSSQFKGMEDYYDWHKRRMILFKPHGSASWGWRFKDLPQDFKRSELIDELFERKIEPWEIYYHHLGYKSDSVEYSSWGIEGKYSLNKNLIEPISVAPPDSVHFPALLLPYRDKDEFVMPYQMQHAMTSCLAETQELFLIGWKGNEALFNRKLKANSQRLKQITIVNPFPQEVRQNLTSAGFDLKQYDVREVKNFEDFVGSHFQ